MKNVIIKIWKAQMLTKNDFNCEKNCADNKCLNCWNRWRTLRCHRSWIRCRRKIRRCRRRWRRWRESATDWSSSCRRRRTDSINCPETRASCRSCTNSSPASTKRCWPKRSSSSAPSANSKPNWGSSTRNSPLPFRWKSKKFIFWPLNQNFLTNFDPKNFKVLTNFD